ncbi:hypothetical protein RIR_jg36673.t1 [Rhizophagus irregularis DAOM 181602=DAOM 197198]|nr:hypothetical protein RIR_jg36673.t1 [Rhizophagus irregularis DAOM 181602=DAOM 197198]
MESHAKQIKIPADLGRIPSKISTGEGFSGFTADQWRACYLLVAQLIENIYGPEMITPNIHLSLHISEYCWNYGSLYSFWCYSFERMKWTISLEVKDTITGSEQFPREMMTPRKHDVILPNDIYNLLVDYYNNVYDLEFVTIADSIESRLQ